MSRLESVRVMRRIAVELDDALTVAELIKSPSGSFFVGFDSGMRLALVSPAAARRALAAFDELGAELFGQAATGPIDAVEKIAHALTYEEGSEPA